MFVSVRAQCYSVCRCAYFLKPSNNPAAVPGVWVMYRGPQLGAYCYFSIVQSCSTICRNTAACSESPGLISPSRNRLFGLVLSLVLLCHVPQINYERLLYIITQGDAGATEH